MMIRSIKTSFCLIINLLISKRTVNPDFWYPAILILLISPEHTFIGSPGLLIKSFMLSSPSQLLKTLFCNFAGHGHITIRWKQVPEPADSNPSNKKPAREVKAAKKQQAKNRRRRTKAGEPETKNQSRGTRDEEPEVSTRKRKTKAGEPETKNQRKGTGGEV
jgi:hypothetical protein